MTITEKDITIIGVPMDLGGPVLGARIGPEALRIANVKEKLENCGYCVSDIGNLNVNNIQVEMNSNNLKNKRNILDACNDLYLNVDQLFREGRFPFILGGDHSIAIGSVKAALNHFPNVGLLWIDAHGDINTEKTTETGNIHGMSIAALLGLTCEELSLIGNDKSIKPENIVYIGLRDLDIEEKKIIKALNIKAYTMDKIDENGMTTILNEAIEHLNKHTDGVHISFDVDSLDPAIAEGTGTKVLGGLSFRECSTIFNRFKHIKNITSLEIVEVNPLLDKKNKTAEVVCKLISKL